MPTFSTTFSQVGECIYCAATAGKLSREHVIPHGLSGEWVLPRASCEDCGRITSRLELELLRGHWLPHRVRLNLRSRRPHLLPEFFKATVEDEYGTRTALLKAAEFSGMVVCTFGRPSVIEGVISTGPPLASGLAWIGTGDMGRLVAMADPRPSSNRKVTLPVGQDVETLVRFFAKVAWSYAVGVRGLSAFRECFVKELVLGRVDGANTYVGQVEVSFGDRLPGDGLHALLVREHGDLLSVCIQLFRETPASTPPIYEVVVGRLAGVSAESDASSGTNDV